MPSCKKWPFLLHHSLHAQFLQLTMKCFCANGLIGDILKCLGSLRWIFNLPYVHKTFSISHICISKLSWMATRGPVDILTVVSTYATDSGFPKTSYVLDRSIRVTRKKQRDDFLSLWLRQLVHWRIELNGANRPWSTIFILHQLVAVHNYRWQSIISTKSHDLCWLGG